MAPQPDQPAQSTDVQVDPVKLPSHFKMFYDQYHSDSTFQVEHTIWPLRRITDDTTSLADWTPETWKLHQPFNDMGGTFERTFTMTDRLILELIVDVTGNYSMERRFQKADDTWRLIYYRPMGAYGQ